MARMKELKILTSPRTDDTQLVELARPESHVLEPDAACLKNRNAKALYSTCPKVTRTQKL